MLSMLRRSCDIFCPMYWLRMPPFYDQIPNMNLYVEHKNPETGMLYDMIIYDVTNGLDNSRVILADSGKFSFTEDKTRLFLHLYNGEMFVEREASEFVFLPLALRHAEGLCEVGLCHGRGRG